MDAAPWPQDINLLKTMEEMASNNTCTKPMLDRKIRPQEQLNCPRCNSTNTKFCYYNNYSLSQPRYFCKTCRRYWTEGGSLRNVPVGGGSRKNKRCTSSPAAAAAASSKLPDLNPPSVSQFPSQNPKTQGQDLNLAFPAMQESQGISHYMEVAKTETNSNRHNPSSSSPSSYSSSPLTSLEQLRTGITSRGLNSFIPTLMPDPNTLYSSAGFPLQEFKPTLNFSLDGLGSRYEIQQNGGKILFPFGELKQVSGTSEEDQNKRSSGTPSGYVWNGMLGGGSW